MGKVIPRSQKFFQHKRQSRDTLLPIIPVYVLKSESHLILIIELTFREFTVEDIYNYTKQFFYFIYVE